MKTTLTRKEFLMSMGLSMAALCCPAGAFGFLRKGAKRENSVKGHIFKGDAPKSPWKWSIEAFHYAADGTNVQCQVCPNRCYLKPGDRSICRSR